MSKSSQEAHRSLLAACASMCPCCTLLFCLSTLECCFLLETCYLVVHAVTVWQVVERTQSQYLGAVAPAYRQGRVLEASVLR